MGLPPLKNLQPLLIWGIADLYFILAVTVTILFGALAPDLQMQLNLTGTQLGFLGFSFFLSFGITQLIAGSLLDSLGPRITLALSALIAFIGLFLLSQANNFITAILAQIIMGIGFSTSYVGTLYLASLWFDKERFSLMSGITQMSAYLVSASIIFFMALSGSVGIDFRKILFSIALMTLLIGMLMLLIVRNKSLPDSAIEDEETSLSDDVRSLFELPQFWFGAIYFITNIAVFLAFSSLWNIPGSLAYGRSLQDATMLSAVLRYGSAAGALISGILASYTGKTVLMVRLFSCGTLALAVATMYGPIYPLVVIFLIFALMGFFFGGTALGFPLAARNLPPHLKGTGFGLMVALAYLLSALLQYLTGALLGINQTGSSEETMHAFAFALTPLVLTLALGCFCTFWLNSDQKN